MSNASMTQEDEDHVFTNAGKDDEAFAFKVISDRQMIGLLLDNIEQDISSLRSLLAKVANHGA